MSCIFTLSRILGPFCPVGIAHREQVKANGHRTAGCSCVNVSPTKDVWRNRCSHHNINQYHLLVFHPPELCHQRLKEKNYIFILVCDVAVE